MEVSSGVYCTFPHPKVPNFGVKHQKQYSGPIWRSHGGYFLQQAAFLGNKPLPWLNLMEERGGLWIIVQRGLGHTLLTAEAGCWVGDLVRCCPALALKGGEFCNYRDHLHCQACFGPNSRFGRFAFGARGGTLQQGGGTKQGPPKIGKCNRMQK